MNSAEQEDMLLSILRFIQATGSNPGIEDLAGQVASPVQSCEYIIDDLISTSQITRTDEGRLSLTKSGRIVAETIMKKHHILESFLQEMLGMDHEKAHEQACTIEHHASDDTINRLRNFLRSSRECPGTCNSPSSSCQCRTLSECQNGDTVVITGIKGCGRALRLADLGIVPGEKITIKQCSSETLLIRVKGCDIAISPEIARSVLVGEAS